jgi:hypothetical protein
MASIDGVRYGPTRTEPPDLSAPRRGGFSVPAGGAGALAKVSQGNDAASSVDSASLSPGMLAVQEYGNEPVAERTARRQGLLLLRQLSLLQISLLAEGPVGEACDQLASLAAALEESITAAIDPKLRALLAPLALRARIELARPRI